MTITFYGAAGSVTGSKHLVEVMGKKILLDCGIWQGLPDVRERNRSFPFPPESIDYVILSHAHLDHSGMLPLLVKRGFTGQIFATPATADVTQHMLEDMAGIEVQDADYRAKHKIGAPDEREPLITPEDIPVTMERFVKVSYARHGQGWHELPNGPRLKLYDAGHILGSAISVLEWQDRPAPQRLAYSGDLGPDDLPLLHNPEVPAEEITTLLLESTYGSRQHEPLGQALDRLADTINAVCQRGGKMIVAAFSLGRTQTLVYTIHKLIDEGRIPRFPIYVDSPLATDITDTYRRHRHNYDDETQRDFAGQDHRPLAFRNLRYTRSVRESKQLNAVEGPVMIISASGMMTAGRVVHHLRHTISHEKNAIFVTGYQAEGTTGRRILEGVKRVELLGDQFDVRAQIALFNEFSAHADRSQLQQFAEQIKGLKQVILVHGEPHQADDLKAQLKQAHPDWEVIRPNEGDMTELL
jgi:metallo-beta-lactamase family protein